MSDTTVRLTRELQDEQKAHAITKQKLHEASLNYAKVNELNKYKKDLDEVTTKLQDALKKISILEKELINNKEELKAEKNNNSRLKRKEKAEKWQQ